MVAVAARARRDRRRGGPRGVNSIHDHTWPRGRWILRSRTTTRRLPPPTTPHRPPMAASPTPTSPPACACSPRSARTMPSSTLKGLQIFESRCSPSSRTSAGSSSTARRSTSTASARRMGGGGTRAEQERAQDAAWANKAVMRARRMRMLQELGDGDGAPRVPDGAVEAAPLRLSRVRRRRRRLRRRRLRRRAGRARAARGALVLHVQGEVPQAARLLRAAVPGVRRAQLGEARAERRPARPLRPRHRLARQDRLPGGAQAAPRRRDGAATTRFPVDAAARFAAAPDFAEWRDRLQVVGLDLRDLRALERFCAHLVATQPRVDIIINNACQTVRRPPSVLRAADRA